MTRRRPSPGSRTSPDPVGGPLRSPAKGRPDPAQPPPVSGRPSCAPGQAGNPRAVPPESDDPGVRSAGRHNPLPFPPSTGVAQADDSRAVGISHVEPPSLAVGSRGLPGTPRDRHPSGTRLPVDARDTYSADSPSAASAPSVAVAVAEPDTRPLPERPLDEFIEFPGEFASAKRVQDRLIAALQDLRFLEPAVFAVKLAVEEAVTNAIRHGNKLDSRRKVRVGWAITPAEVLITVADEGAGFNPELLPDCTAPENLEVPNGRGVMLMRAFMSAVVYSRTGNQVWLLRRNDETLPD